jgi:hypothetical protein
MNSKLPLSTMTDTPFFSNVLRNQWQSIDDEKADRGLATHDKVYKGLHVTLLRCVCFEFKVVLEPRAPSVIYEYPEL